LLLNRLEAHYAVEHGVHGLENSRDRRRHFVLVALRKPSDVVVYRRTRMNYCKSLRLALGHHYVLAFAMVFNNALDNGRFRLVDLGGLVQQVEKADRLSLEQVDHRLVVFESKVDCELL
jgi:hypothetical protein